MPSALQQVHQDQQRKPGKKNKRVKPTSVQVETEEGKSGGSWTLRNVIRKGRISAVWVFIIPGREAVVEAYYISLPHFRLLTLSLDDRHIMHQFLISHLCMRLKRP